MADGTAAAIDIHAEDAGVEAFVDDLVVVTAGVIAIGPVEEAVFGVEEHAAAVVPDGLVGEVDENGNGGGGGDAVRIKGVAFETVVVGVGEIGDGAGGGAAGNGAGFHPGVIHEHLVVGGVAGMEGDAEQAGVIPALALVAEVEDEFFFGHAGVVAKGPDAAFAFPDAEFIGAGDGGEADAVREEEIGEGVDGGPVAGDGGGDFGQGTIQEGGDGRSHGQSVGPGVEGEGEHTGQTEEQPGQVSEAEGAAIYLHKCRPNVLPVSRAVKLIS